jgi:hypothetical protein
MQQDTQDDLNIGNANQQPNADSVNDTVLPPVSDYFGYFSITHFS